MSRAMSWTSLSTFASCPERYRRRYLLGEKRPPGIAAYVGRATDGSVEHNLGVKIETGELAPRDEVAEVARDRIEADVDRDGVLLTSEEAGIGIRTVKGEAKDRTVRLSLHHYDEVAPGIEAVGIQRKWKIASPALPVELTGRIDIEVPAGVIDLKTSRKSPARDAADRSEQLTIYALAFRAMHGVNAELLALDYLVDLKGGPTFRRLTTERGPERYQSLFRRISRTAEAIEAGNFPPASRDWWGCDPRYCGFYDDCPYT